MKRTKAELLKKIHGGQTCQIVSCATRLGIFDALENGPKTAAEIAQTIDADKPSLTRLLYALVALYLLEGDNPFSLNEQSRFLLASHPESMRAIAIYKGSPLLYASYQKLYEGIKTGKSPFSLAFGTDLFTHLESHPKDAEIFHNAMASYTSQSSTHLLSLFDFSKTPHLLDIGGGNGTFLKSIQTHYPTVQGTSLDLPPALTKMKDGITPHIGSFFDTIPSGYDGYILRNILHDWSDEQCVTILTNIQAALGNAPLFLFESLVMPQTNTRLGKFADLTMFLLTEGGKERSEEDFRTLCSKANLSIKNVYKTTGSKALLEIYSVPFSLM